VLLQPLFINISLEFYHIWQYKELTKEEYERLLSTTVHMKKLCNDAQVPYKKVFPHNHRHLFARTYYSYQNDVV